MSFKTYANTPLEQLHREFVGRVINRLSGPMTLPRQGIITNIIRNQFYTQAVVLYNDDEEYIGMDFHANDEYAFKPVGVYPLETITDKHRWEIKDHGIKE